MELRERLTAVAKLVPQGAKIADIGTDHAYLPVALLHQKKIKQAIAADIHEGPYRLACSTVKEAGFAAEIDVRLGDGLTPLTPGEVDTVILAGMGGETMIAILTARPAVTLALSHLVLQPMTSSAKLRAWLKEHGWTITDEALAVEEKHLYEIIRADHREPQTSQEIEAAHLLTSDPLFCEIGPMLWLRKPPLFRRFLTQKVEELEKILGLLSRAPSSSATVKRAECAKQYVWLKEKLACL